MQRWQAAERSAILAGAMGLTVLELEIANPARPAVTERVDLLIDSGAIYSVVPAAVLARLGIEPLVEQQFRLANGSKISRKKGGAVFKRGDRIGVADVIFGEEADSPLLGATTLEALGLSLDPIRRELEPLPLILAAVRGAGPTPARARGPAPPGRRARTRGCRGARRPRARAA